MMKEQFTPFTVDSSTHREAQRTRVGRGSHRSYAVGYSRPLAAKRRYGAQTVDRSQVSTRTTEGEDMALNKKMQPVKVPVERTPRLWRVMPQKKRPSKAQKWLKRKRATQVRKFHRGMMIWSQRFDRF
jgi:hypothetical protein